jgi:hypothetical protein
MRPFGTPRRQIGLDDEPADIAAWMLELVDESPDRLAIVTIPPHRDDDDLDAMESRFISAYDIAKAERPNLSVKLLHALDLHNGQPRDRIAVAVHEHKWVAGQCVNGCPDTRKEG